MWLVPNSFVCLVKTFVKQCILKLGPGQEPILSCPIVSARNDGRNAVEHCGNCIPGNNSSKMIPDLQILHTARTMDRCYIHMKLYITHSWLCKHELPVLLRYFVDMSERKDSTRKMVVQLTEKTYKKKKTHVRDLCQVFYEVDSYGI